jgi:hypothetical protein
MAMDKWATVDRGLRVLSASAAVLLLFLTLLAAIFATDSGTTASTNIATAIAVGGVVICGLLFFASVAPQRLEPWLPGSPSVKRLIVRGPCYVVAVGVPIVWFVLAYR